MCLSRQTNLIQCTGIYGIMVNINLGLSQISPTKHVSIRRTSAFIYDQFIYYIHPPSIPRPFIRLFHYSLFIDFYLLYFIFICFTLFSFAFFYLVYLTLFYILYLFLLLNLFSLFYLILFSLFFIYSNLFLFTVLILFSYSIVILPVTSKKITDFYKVVYRIIVILKGA